MGIEELARLLSDPKILGLDESDGKKVGLRGFDSMRGELLSQANESRGHTGVYLLSIFVVDDTDLIGKGEIYWWALPMIGTSNGKITWNASSGLPTGAPPVKTGDLQWMKTPSLDAPPLLALIPPTDDVVACLIRFGLYDDDMAPVDIPKGLRATCEAIADQPEKFFESEQAFLEVARKTLWTALIAKNDDLLAEGTIKLLREDGVGYSAGNIGSIVTEKAQVYYFARDEVFTKQAGPVKVPKDGAVTLDFGAPIKAGGTLAIFARGGVVDTPFGPLTTDGPFRNVYVSDKEAEMLSKGIRLTTTGKGAEVIAFYTARS